MTEHNGKTVGGDPSTFMERLFSEDPDQVQDRLTVEALMKDPVISSILVMRQRENILVEVLAMLVHPANRKAFAPEVIEKAWYWIDEAGYSEAIPRATIEEQVAEAVRREAEGE